MTRVVQDGSLMDDQSVEIKRCCFIFSSRNKGLLSADKWMKMPAPLTVTSAAVIDPCWLVMSAFGAVMRHIQCN